ncbi:uncharacterized protein [Physcomitrium patens]
MIRMFVKLLERLCLELFCFERSVQSVFLASVNSVDDLQNATRSGDPYYELADDLKWPANYAPTGEGQPKLQATYLSNRESGARQKIHLYLKRLMLQQKRTWKPKGT